jgi:hypothetical protein
MGLFDIIKQLGVGVGSGLDYAQKSIGNYNLTQKYGPMWQDQFAEQQRRHQEAEKNRQHAEFQRKEDIAAAPITRENRELRNEALKASAQERGDQQEEDAAYEEGWTSQIKSYSEIDQALINSKNVWATARNAHLADPSGDQLPKTTEAQNRMAKARMEGAQAAQKHTVTSQELARRQRLVSESESPESIQEEEDRKAGLAESLELTNQIKKEQLGKLREGERNSPADNRRRIALATEGFRKNMSDLENIGTQAQARVLAEAEDQLGMIYDDPIASQKVIARAEQAALRAKSVAIIRNSSAMIPGAIRHKIINGAELADWEESLMHQWFTRITSLPGIRKKDIFAVEPNVGELIRLVFENDKQGVVGYSFVGEQNQ